MQTRPKAKSSYMDESKRQKLKLNFRSYSNIKELEHLNCIGEEAKVDSAKTEESKYWFPSHARKRSENTAAENSLNNPPGSSALHLNKNVRSSLEKNERNAFEDQEQQISRVNINSLQSSMSSSKAAETKLLPQRTLFVGSLLKGKPSDLNVTHAVKISRVP